MRLDAANSGFFGRFFGLYTEEFYLLFRLAFALLISLHGAQKALLLWGFPADEGFTTLHHGGEVVFVYFMCAGIIGILGSGKWGLERMKSGKELL